MSKGCQKDLVQRARSVSWKKWAAKHGYEELKRGSMAGTRARSSSYNSEGELD